jgi:farnesol dehydrogenase
MKAFVTGATGYVGLSLIRRLLEEGVKVKALCRRQSLSLLKDFPGIEIVVGDLSDPDLLRKGMETCEQVYHLAAYARVWSEDKSIYHLSNVEGTRLMLEASRINGVKKFVFTSTAGTLGPQLENNSPVTEDTVREQDFFNEYEQTKWEAEQLCKSYASGDMQVIIVNPSRIYGPGIDVESNAVSKLINLYMEGKWRFIPGDGKKIGNYVFVDDVVRGHINAMNNGRSGEQYILGGENYSYDDFFLLIRELTGVNQKLYHIPLWAMLAFSKLELLRARMFNRSPLITPSWVKKYLYDWPLSSGKAQREWGYSPTSLRKGLGKTIEYIKLGAHGG